MTKRYQVFISSTHTDLVSERESLIKELLKFNCIPAAMEFFQPINKKSLDVIMKIIDDCDYLVLIIAGRYGSAINGKPNGISFTESEYKYAIEKNIPVIPLLLDEEELERLKKSKKKADRERLDLNQKRAKQKRLTQFRSKLEKLALVSYFRWGESISLVVANALRNAIQIEPMPGWVREKDRNIVLLAEEMEKKQQKNYLDIKDHFKQTRRFITRLRQAHPFTKDMLEVKSNNRRAISNKNKKLALASKFYFRNRKTKQIDPHADLDHDILYAMCFVASNRLHTSDNHKDDTHFPENWWDPPWDDVALYISKICSNNGFNRTVKMLLRKSHELDDEYRIKCLVLIYRMIMSRDMIDIEILRRVNIEVSSL